ncbi:MAG: pseudouridine-5'-phosphate glycosidase, partial [Chloroflexi bacterium]|nr:pseudouridine-5'-phosphate glycosidase [Chloroflexota bacterium]
MSFSLSPEVSLALAAGRPVVALESTVIAHGLPRPRNLELARRMEAIVRDCGATPATVAILGGQVKVGLTDDELFYLANTDGVWKVSRRDFGVVAARKADGATTVAGTMIAAAWAGIKVFATGGIGGVHRGDGTDVSADLPELARTSVAVVCAGAKAILDLPATLEWLETAGVPVIGLQTDEFPAFYSRSSGLRLEARAESTAEAAAMVKAKW